MKFHHFGIACKDFESLKLFYRKQNYSIGEEVYDLETLIKEILGLNSSDIGDIPLHGSSTVTICDEIQKTCG